jgi:hydroxymethylpyrimidine/phosphomethylpyrimidine kinase
MHRAAQAIRGLGIRAVIIKGGHLQEQKKRAEAIDILDNDGVVTIFRSVRIDLAGVRGTGCTLSAGIAACLAKGMSLEDAVRAAKQYVTEIIRRRADVV